VVEASLVDSRRDNGSIGLDVKWRSELACCRSQSTKALLERKHSNLTHTKYTKTVYLLI
jgi:hypothetical protein